MEQRGMAALLGATAKTCPVFASVSVSGVDSEVG
jgi:hypothetical protein